MDWNSKPTSETDCCTMIITLKLSNLFEELGWVKTEKINLKLIQTYLRGTNKEVFFRKRCLSVTGHAKLDRTFFHLWYKHCFKQWRSAKGKWTQHEDNIMWDPTGKRITTPRNTRATYWTVTPAVCQWLPLWRAGGTLPGRTHSCRSGCPPQAHHQVLPQARGSVQLHALSQARNIHLTNLPS